MIASASRRARNLPKPRARQRLVGRHRALGLRALDRDAAGLERRRRRQAAQPRPEARPARCRRMMNGSISTATIRRTPRKAGTAPAGSVKIAWTCTSSPSTMSVRVIGKPSRSTLLISTTSSAPRKLPRTRPRPPRIEAPPMMTAAMTISSALRPACGDDALVLGDRHQAGERGAERGEQIGADAHPARRDAGVDRGLLVAAGGEGLVAPAGLGEHERRRWRRRRARSESGC